MFLDGAHFGVFICYDMLQYVGTEKKLKQEERNCWNWTESKDQPNEMKYAFIAFCVRASNKKKKKRNIKSHCWLLLKSVKGTQVERRIDKVATLFKCYQKFIWIIVTFFKSPMVLAALFFSISLCPVFVFSRFTLRRNDRYHIKSISFGMPFVARFQCLLIGVWNSLLGW